MGAPSRGERVNCRKRLPHAAFPSGVLRPVASRVLCGVAGGRPPEKGTPEALSRPVTDANLQQAAAPEKVQTLRMRGHAAYGTDGVTDAGMAYIGCFKNLRVPGAGGPELTYCSLEAIGEPDNLDCVLP